MVSEDLFMFFYYESMEQMTTLEWPIWTPGAGFT